MSGQYDWQTMTLVYQELIGGNGKALRTSFGVLDCCESIAQADFVNER